NGVVAHQAPYFRSDMELRQVHQDSRFLLLGEESRQVEMRLSGPCRRDDELDAQIARMGAGADVLQSGTAEGDAAEGRAEVFDGEDRGLEGADGWSWQRVSSVSPDPRASSDARFASVARAR